MNAFDCLLIAILAYSTVKAIFRGIILELFALVGAIAGILLASWNCHQAAPFVERIVTNPAIALVVSFFLIVASVMVLGSLLGRVLNHTAHAVGLGFFDRLLGALFGFLRGWLIGVTILIGIAAFLPHSTWVEDSHLTPYFLAGVHAVSFVVPEDLKQQILSGAAQIKHNAPDWIKPLP